MPSHRLVNIADELAIANYRAVVNAKSGSDLLPHSLHRAKPTTVGWAIGEFVCSGASESEALADLVYEGDDYDIPEEEFDRRVELLIKQQHPELANAAEYVHEWTMQVKKDAHGWRYPDD